jgi:Spy/CpxP family protein refolding chaperone
MAPGAGPRGGGGFEPGPGFGFEPGHEAMGKLDLSEAQREKLADLRERTMKQNIQTGADLRIAQMDLHKLMRAETPDARAIEAQIDKVSGLRAAIQKARAAALLDARSVLTPEQQKKLRQMRGSMRPGMGRGPGGPHGMGGPGGPGPHGGPGGPSEGDDDI